MPQISLFSVASVLEPRSALVRVGVHMAWKYNIKVSRMSQGEHKSRWIAIH